MAVRVGIDLVSVASVRDAMAAHPERYLERIYTVREVADCRTERGVDPERLAARFAAKEAAIKVLRPDAGGVGWRAIEIRREPGGWLELALAGGAADLARRTGLRDFAVSVTHEAGFASAVVVAEVAPECR